MQKEIIALQKLFKDYNIVITVLPDFFISNNTLHPAVQLSLNNQVFKFFIDDEYNDIQYNNKLLLLCLVLRELENYQNSDDYLTWCSERFLDSSITTVREYHMSLRTTYNTIQRIIGTIDSQISDYDFQLNAGAAQELRSKN